MNAIEKYIVDLESVTAYQGIGKNSRLPYTDMMFCARTIAELSGPYRKNIVDLGTNRGQSTCLFSLIGQYVTTVDFRQKNLADARAIIKRYGDIDRVKFMTCDSCDQSAIGRASSIGPVDVLFIDTNHTVAQVIREINAWFPTLADDAIVFFHDTIWCADSVMEPIMRMATSDTHYRIVNDNVEIRDWPGIGSACVLPDGRPSAQSKEETADATRQFRFIRDEWQSPGAFDANTHDISLAHEMRWPGMVALQRGTATWAELVDRVNANKS